MSLESDLNRALSILVSFMKETASANLAMAKNEGRLNMDEEQVRQTAHVVETSIDQAFSKGYNQILHVIKNQK